MSVTTSLLTWPPRTISTTSIVSASDTRMPCTNSPFLPMRASSSSICGPPPCTITGFMPTSLSRTTSCAKLLFSVASVMAFPPYFTTMVRPWKRLMYGSASARTLALWAAVMEVSLIVALLSSSDCTCRGAKKEKAAVRPPFCAIADERLLDRELLRRYGRLLRQRQLEHAIVVLRAGARFVDLLPEPEGTRYLADIELAMQNALAVLGVAFDARLRGNGHLV